MANIVDWSKPIQLRGGDVVRLVGDIDGIDGRNKAVAIKRTQGSGIGKEFVRDYPKDGMYYASKQPDDLDIINVPPEKIKIDLTSIGYYANVYHRTDGTRVLVVNPSLMPAGTTSSFLCQVKLPDFLELEVVK